MFKITYKNGFPLDSPFNFPVSIWSSIVEALTEWPVSSGYRQLVIRDITQKLERTWWFEFSGLDLIPRHILVSCTCQVLARLAKRVKQLCGGCLEPVIWVPPAHLLRWLQHDGFWRTADWFPLRSFYTAQTGKSSAPERLVWPRWHNNQHITGKTTHYIQQLNRVIITDFTNMFRYWYTFLAFYECSLLKFI